MTKKIIIIVAVIIIAIVAITKFVFPICENEILNNAESKDGKYIATLYSRSCGATTDDYTNIDIVKKNSFIRFKKNIFRIKGYDTFVDVGWDKEKLYVNYSGNPEPLKKVDSWRGLSIEYYDWLKDIIDKNWKFPIMKEVVSAIKPFSNLETGYFDGNFILWKKNGYLVYMANADTLSLSYNRVPKGFDSNNNSTENVYRLTPLGPVSDVIAKVFEDNSFTPNKLNSTNLQNYEYVRSYEKDNLVCKVTLSDEVTGGRPVTQDAVHLEVGCATGLDKQFNEQKPFVDLLVALKGYNKKDFAVGNIKQKDDFFSIGDTDGTEGATSILKKIGNKYVLVDGPLQEPPECKKMDQWHVPKEIYGDCYDVDHPFGS